MNDEMNPGASTMRVGSGDDSLAAESAARELVLRQMAGEAGWGYYLAESGERLASLAYRYEVSRRQRAEGSHGVTGDEWNGDLESVRDAAVNAELAETGVLVSRLAAVFAASFDAGVAVATDEMARAAAPPG